MPESGSLEFGPGNLVAVKTLPIYLAYDISERKTFEREITSLLAIKDAYPKMLVARTYQPPYQHEGIRVIDAAEWLNEKEH